MQIISLNTWGGRAGKEKLLDFFKQNKDVDVFCLQEIWSAPYDHLEGSAAGGLAIDHSNIMVHGLQEISEVLSSHAPHFRPHHLDNYGLLMLIKKKLSVEEEGEFWVYKEKGYVPEGDVGGHARNVQYATVITPYGPRTIMNFHGLWNGHGKTDSPDRLTQSKHIVDFVTTLPTPFALCGDFNLLPDTESLAILERSGMRNLVKEYGITSTRTSYYNKPEKFADYVLVGQGLAVKDFRVLPDEVSDHCPVSITIE